MLDPQAAAIVVFALTYLCIAFNRIPRLHVDRPGAALAGAVLMVVCGVLSFDEAWQAIDARTIVLLLGMMVLNVFLEEGGFFELSAKFVLRRAKSPVRILVGLALLSGVLSALFLNDTVCLMLTPPLLIILRRTALPATPFLVTLAMAANVGSVMTITGNPQNMLVGIYSGWTYSAFLLRMLPVGLVGLAVMIGILVWFYGPILRTASPPLILGGAGGGQNVSSTSPHSTEATGAPVAIDVDPPHRPPQTPPRIRGGGQPANRPLLFKSLLVLAGVLAGFILTSDLPLVAIVGAMVLLVWSGEPPARVLARVNWVLLLFFAGLFIVVRGLETTGIVKAMADAARPLYGTSLGTQVPVFSGLTVVASNVVSNVPFVMLARNLVGELIDPPLMWLVLAMASTFAGNLTIPGSVATLIVLEAARDSGTISYLEFLRVGIPVTIATVAAGALVLLCESWFW